MAEQDCCGTVILRGPKGDQGEPGPAAETNVLVKDPITADGTGTEGDPYVIGLALSADYGNNNLSIGSDGGLYSPKPDGSETIVTAATGVEVTGVGTVDDPYVITSTVTAADLGAITTVTGTGGVTATTTGTDVTVSADISTAVGNQLSLNADGGLYVAAQTDVGDNTYVLGEGLVQSGTGTAEDPYVLSVMLSADAGNAITFGTDGGLYVPDVAAGVSSVSAADDTVTVTPTEGDVTVAANLSADTGNTLAAGSDGGLYVPGPVAGPGIAVTEDEAGTGYTIGLAPAFAFADLRTPTFVKPDTGWVTVPLSFVTGVGASVSGDIINLTQPGVWFINAQVNVNGYYVTGVLYTLIGGTYSGGSNYAGYYLDGSGKRFGAPTHSMVISDGTGTAQVQVQVGSTAGTQSPQINAVNVQCTCVQPMTAAAARDLRASLPADSGVLS